MQLDDKYMSLEMFDLKEALITLNAIAEFSEIKFTGKESFDRMPPTNPAATITASGLTAERKPMTLSSARRSKSARSTTITFMSDSNESRRTIADPTSPL
jgi:hypothetical protein